jgi:hypothetical protein
MNSPGILGFILGQDVLLSTSVVAKGYEPDFTVFVSLGDDVFSETVKQQVIVVVFEGGLSRML